MQYIVAYDIADPKRMQRVARRVEQVAIRCQKSVFLLNGRFSQVQRLFDTLSPIIDAKLDVVQAWKIDRDTPPGGWSLGTVADDAPVALILGGSTQQMISRVRPAPDQPAF